MIAGNVKRFSVTKLIPKDFKNNDLRRIEGIFEEVCGQVLQSPYKTYVSTNDTKRGKTITFLVSFGSAQPSKESLYNVIRQLVDVTLWQSAATDLQKKAVAKLNALSKIYNRDCVADTKSHIKVKPNEHIKIC